MTSSNPSTDPTTTSDKTTNITSKETNHSETQNNTTTNTNNVQIHDLDDDDEDLLVSEFPPPPYYYKLAHTEKSRLPPPPIPQTKLEIYSKNAAIVLRNAVQLMESKFRKKDDSDTTKDNDGDVIMQDTNDNQMNIGVDAAQTELTANMVTVFGDVTVEDPSLVSIADDCADPTRVRDAVIRLNQKVIQGYIKLVNELVHKPLDNKECRDELSHNVLLMLHECNKFREHQAREILIQTLEEQLLIRKSAITLLQKENESAANALKSFREKHSSSS